MGIRTPVNASHDKGPVPTQAAFDWFGNSMVVPSPASFQVASSPIWGQTDSVRPLFCPICTFMRLHSERHHCGNFNHTSHETCFFLPPCLLYQFRSTTSKSTRGTTALPPTHKAHPPELNQQPPDPTTDELTTPTLATRTNPDEALRNEQKTTSPPQTMR